MIAERAERLSNVRASHRAAVAKEAPIAMTLLPVIAIMFVAFLVIGLAMPVLPLYVHHGLGFGMVVVGLVAGAQFAVSVASRFYAGHQADHRGAKRTITIGLLMAVASGFLYLGSVAASGQPTVSLILLLTGRGVLGGGESFIVAGCFVWGLGLAGPKNTGAVMSLVGAPMYVAYAIGAPIGSLLYAHVGFAGITYATMTLPLVALLVLAPCRSVQAQVREKADVRAVLRAVAVPGLGVAFSSIGLGTVTTFAALHYAHQGWPTTWLAFTAMSAAFVIARAALGHLPDRFGGARVALACAIVEAAGQALMWLAPSSLIATVGAALTGFGYALVYPSLGVEAIRRAPAQSRGLASGAYTACLDVALGIGNPVFGGVASAAGLASVFGVGALLVLGAAVIALMLTLATPKKAAPHGN